MADESPERVAIGITIGNSNSSIAYTVDDKPEVIANEDGDRQIPTVLSYVGGEEYYGNQAKSFLVRNPQNTVTFFRDFIGQDFASVDPTHCHAAAHPQETDGAVAFSVIDSADADAAASSLTVSEVTTRYLRRLVGSASDYLGKKVTSAVVSVPTNFSPKQRDALAEAARAADIEILQLVSDPAAALLAYDARPGAAVADDKVVVVVDLGGTRSDVAVIAARGGMYTILATAHDYEFAGVHLDNALMDHFAKEFLKKHPTAADPRSNPRSLAKLRLESELTKRALSLGSSATFSVESLSDGLDFSLTINRTRFEMIGRKVFDGFDRLVDAAVKKAGLDVLHIDEVLLAGGSSNIPRVAANMRSNIFTDPTTTIVAPSTSPKAINPSELHVRGAALQASLIHQYDADDIAQSSHAAVTTVPHTSNAIGIVVSPASSSSSSSSPASSFLPIIHAETAIPARRTITVPAPSAGGDVLVQLVEGGTHIAVTKPEPKPAPSKSATVADAAEGDDDDDNDDDDSDDEPEEDTREKVWKVGSTLAEAAVRDTKPGASVEVTVSLLADLSVTVTAREVGAKTGVRGTLPPVESS